MVYKTILTHVNHGGKPGVLDSLAAANPYLKQALDGENKKRKGYRSDESSRELLSALGAELGI
jgi:hypothetical protein